VAVVGESETEMAKAKDRIFEEYLMLCGWGKFAREVFDSTSVIGLQKDT
jgi:hypothetical protein